MRRPLLFALVLLLSNVEIKAQQDELSFDIESQAGYTTPDHVPFWLRSNQYGSIPLDKGSFSLLGSAQKAYNKEANRFFDWGASLSGRINIGYRTSFTLVEGYAKIKASMLELKVGRAREIIGLCDTNLSAGSFSIAGNALGIPKVQLSIPEYHTIPWFGKLFAIKGSFAHGWIGNIYERRANRDTFLINTYFHQKSLYGRFGKPSWRVKLHGGFNHQAFWGNEKDLYGDVYTLSPFKSYMYVISGTPYFNSELQMSSKVGNHLGSIDLGLEYEFKNIRILIYRQNFYETGALYYLANLRDGLNGISIENKRNSSGNFHWSKIHFDFFYSKNQSGQPYSPKTPTPYENYHNHYQYVDGWSYEGVALGTPFITPKSSTRDGLPSFPFEYYNNNRVRVFHFAFQGSIHAWDFTTKVSWSNNYGTYYTSDEEQSTDIPDPGAYGIFGKKNQFSGYIECSKTLNQGIKLGCMAAFDAGELYNDAAGLILSVSKSF